MYGSVKIRDINRTVGGCLLRAGLLTALSLLVATAPVVARSSNEEALRGRVEQLYGALQRSDWREAEKYLTKESKATFRNQPKKPISGYQIQSIKLEASGERASVVVQVPIFAAFAPRPLIIPSTTQWRLVKGVWYLELLDPHANQSAFGAPPQKQASSPPPSLHSTDLKFESTWAGLSPIHKGEVKVARFAVTNVSQHVVTVSVGQTSCDCLRMKSPQKQFKPGEAGVIEFELDSSSLSFNVEQALTLTVMLASEPEHAHTQLTIATILAPGPPPPP
jgi:hypothetical protein